MGDYVEASFADVLRDAIEGLGPRQRFDDERIQRNAIGAQVRLPTAQFAIPYDAIDGQEKARQFDFPMQPTDALFGLFLHLMPREMTGYVPVGDLPTAQTILESSQLSADTDPSTITLAYACSRVATARSQFTLQLDLQDPEFSDYIEAALAASLRREIVRQVLIGNGTPPNAQGLSTLTGVHEAMYQTTGVAANDLVNVEQAVVDAKADEMALSWVAGSTVHSALVTTAIEPGDHRRIAENRRVTLSGASLFRSPDLPTGMALCMDPLFVTVIMHGEMLLVVDRVSKPGDVKLTARLPFDIKYLRAGQVGRLVSA